MNPLSMPHRLAAIQNAVSHVVQADSYIVHIIAAKEGHPTAVLRSEFLDEHHPPFNSIDDIMQFLTSLHDAAIDTIRDYWKRSLNVADSSITFEDVCDEVRTRSRYGPNAGKEEPDENQNQDQKETDPDEEDSDL